MSPRPRIRAVTPLLRVGDLQRSIDFYCDKLGFVEPSVHGDPPCFAMLNRDGFDLMLSLLESAAPIRSSGSDDAWDLYISLADVASEADALTAAGVPLVNGPRDTFYGMREIECLDPDGHRLCLAQDISDELFRIAEVWTGALELGDKTLRLILKLAPSDGRLVGRLDSPDQGAMNMPIDSVIRDGPSFRFEMQAIGALYDGIIQEDRHEIVGQWSQSGHTWPLVFRRS
jgi:catechol 2,3-dioxygenase-like lactoylglutathione lyase family enzyme